MLWSLGMAEGMVLGPWNEGEDGVQVGMREGWLEAAARRRG